MTLIEFYNEELENYHDTGERNHPSNLLALLLLDKKDEFEPLKVNEGEFYNAYKEEIDREIDKVTKDFNFSKEDFINYIEGNLGFYDEKDYEEDKLWQVFGEGFGVLHWGLMYRPDCSGEEIYFDYFGDTRIKDNNHVKKLGGLK